MLELCRNRNLGDNIRFVNGAFFRGWKFAFADIWPRCQFAGMRIPFITISTAALWFAFGDCVILCDGKAVCVALLVGVRVRHVSS